jgi:hypothetical protein
MFARLPDTLRRLARDLRAALACGPIPCWTEYLHATRDRG